MYVEMCNMNDDMYGEMYVWYVCHLFAWKLGSGPAICMMESLPSWILENETHIFSQNENKNKNMFHKLGNKPVMNYDAIDKMQKII